MDATRGTIAPISLAPDVRTIGEVLDHPPSSGPRIDCRQPAYYPQGTLTGAVNIPHHDIDGRRHELDPRRRPWCSGTGRNAPPRRRQ